MADLFLSYKSDDRERVAPLVAALQADGLALWWDAHIGGGSAWRDTIEAELAAARCVLVVWSVGSTGPGGSFVRDEATRALRRGVYLPARIDPVEPPLGFGETQALSLIGWKGDRADPRYAALLVAARAVIAGEKRPLAVTAPARRGIDRRMLIGGGAAAAAAAGVGGWEALRGGTGDAAAKRIAVLPFANLSGDPAQSYFADGIAEELRGALSRLGLEVIGRTSSEAVRHDDAKTAAAKLGAGSVLTGSVRRSPSLIRVTAELVEGASGVERWQNSYDRPAGDALVIQSDIATSVAGALRVALGMAARAAIALGGTANAAAQDIVLKALAAYRASDSGEAACRQRIAAIDTALALDPVYVDAMNDKAGSLWVLAGLVEDPGQAAGMLSQSERLARQAIALAPGLALPHATLANIVISQLKLAEALHEAERAIVLAPGEARVLLTAAQAVRDIGSPKHALEYIDRGIALDPLSASAFNLRANALSADHRFAEAEASARKGLAIAFKLTGAEQLALALLLQDKAAETRATLAKLPSGNVFRLTYEACLAARTHSPDFPAAMARLRKEGGDGAAYQFAQADAQAGDADRAFADLEAAVRLRDQGLTSLRFDPLLDPIRADPRMAALIARLGFPA